MTAATAPFSLDEYLAYFHALQHHTVIDPQPNERFVARRADGSRIWPIERLLASYILPSLAGMVVGYLEIIESAKVTQETRWLLCRLQTSQHRSIIFRMESAGINSVMTSLWSLERLPACSVAQLPGLQLVDDHPSSLQIRTSIPQSEWFLDEMARSIPGWKFLRQGDSDSVVSKKFLVVEMCSGPFILMAAHLCRRDGRDKRTYELIVGSFHEA